MNIYLDDSIASALLARLLRNAGHDVQLPADAGLAGEDDPVHLAHAIDEGRVCLSEDHDDFAKLHHLILRAQGHHPGICVVRRDNDPQTRPEARRGRACRREAACLRSSNCGPVSHAEPLTVISRPSTGALARD